MKKLTSMVLAIALLLCCFSFAGAEEAVNLELMLHKSEVVDIMNVMADAFHEEYPNITVTVNQPAEYATAIQTRVLSGDTPDLFTWSNDQSWYAYFRDGYCVDFSGMEWVTGATNEAAREMITIDGGLYGLPYMQNAWGVLYNVDLFEQNGIAIPTTMDEFWAACEALKAAGITPIELTDADAWTTFNVFETLFGLYSADQAALFNAIADGSGSATTDESIRKVAEIFVKLKQYAQPDPLSTSYTDGVTALANGQAAMLLNGTWAYTLVKAAGEANISCFAFPAETAEATRVRANVDLAFSVFKDGKHQEECYTFLQWMIANAQKFVDMEGSVNLVNGVVNATPAFDVFAQFATEGRTFTLARNQWKSGTNTVIQPLTQILRESDDVDSFLADVDNEVKLHYAE
ncbi:MAG: ABC transporter substrate-binding protein [Eubacteriales bacterium]|nr:ABC transporter substrate-binding protein [Eubacteriales bacterium]